MDWMVQEEKVEASHDGTLSGGHLGLRRKQSGNMKAQDGAKELPQPDPPIC